VAGIWEKFEKVNAFSGQSRRQEKDRGYWHRWARLMQTAAIRSKSGNVRARGGKTPTNAA